MNTAQKGTSLLRVSAPPRPLPIALGQELARTKAGDRDRHHILGRIFHGLSLRDQLACQAELTACRAARRGQSFAEVT